MSAPRGALLCIRSQSPVVLLSAGVVRDARDVDAARTRRRESEEDLVDLWSAQLREHRFAVESCSLLKQLSRGRRIHRVQQAAATDQVGADFDALGHIDTALLEKIGASPGSDFYLCGPASFLQNMKRWVANLGSARRKCALGNFRVARRRLPLEWRRLHTLLTCHKGRPDWLSSHSRAAGLRLLGIRNSGSLLELAEACDVRQMVVPDWSLSYLHDGSIDGSIIDAPEPLERPLWERARTLFKKRGVTLDL